MSIHTKIAQLRQAKGWSQQKLADEVSRLEGAKKSFSYSTVQQWEAGRTAPKRTRMPFVAKALGVNIEELLHEGVDVLTAAHIDAPLQTREDRAEYNASAWPFKTVKAAELHKLHPETIEQLERIVCAFLGVQMPSVHWRPVALRVAAELDKSRGKDEFTTFVRAVDFEMERERGRLLAAAPQPEQAPS